MSVVDILLEEVQSNFFKLTNYVLVIIRMQNNSPLIVLATGKQHSSTSETGMREDRLSDPRSKGWGIITSC